MFRSLSLPRLVALTALGVAFAAPASAQAACDRYAAPGGSDGASGSADAPLRTPQRLVDKLGPGETGCLRGGTYDDIEDGYIARIGESGRTLRSAPGERARLVGITMVAHGANRVTLSGLDFVGTRGANSVKIYGADTVVEDSDVTNRLRGESCLMLGSSSGGRAVRPVIRRNVIHDCGTPSRGNKDHGIYVAKASGGEIVGNVIANPVAYAIQLYPDAQRTRVARNVIDGGRDTVRGGIVIGGDGNSTSHGNVVERNVISHTATAAVVGYWPSRQGRGNVARDNCVWGVDSDEDGDGGFRRQHNVVGNPGFLGRGRGDYRLAAGSPCLAVVGSDLLG